MPPALAADSMTMNIGWPLAVFAQARGRLLTRRMPEPDVRGALALRLTTDEAEKTSRFEHRGANMLCDTLTSRPLAIIRSRHDCVRYWLSEASTRVFYACWSSSTQAAPIRATDAM